MKLSFKVGTKGIKNFSQKITRTIGDHFFFSFLIVVLFVIILGGAIFYNYVFLSENEKIDISERPVFFNEDVYKKVLEELSSRKKIIEDLNSKQYSNPFVPISNETSPS